MDCSRCGKLTDFLLTSVPVCDHCVAADQDLYYSTEYLRVIEERLAAPRQRLRVLAERGLGDDKLMNPTKGRARLRDAQDSVQSLEGTRSLIRSVLVARGEIEPTIEEELERAFPNAKHNQIVDWQGRRFRHLWIHDGYDRAGQNLWTRGWELIP